MCEKEANTRQKNPFSDGYRISQTGPGGGGGGCCHANLTSEGVNLLLRAVLLPFAYEV